MKAPKMAETASSFPLKACSKRLNTFPVINTLFVGEVKSKTQF
jgi:hypothetical protein